MATDYDTPRKTDDDLNEDSIEELKARRNDKSTSTVDIDECRFRMLKPREHGRAQRFPDSYRVYGNQSEQTMGFGNAVSSNVVQWLGVIIAALLGDAAPTA